jgi:hypothetical protein
MMLIICLYSQQANYVIIVVMDNNNIVLQINGRQAFLCPPTLKGQSFPVGINNYGMQMCTTSDPLAFNQRFAYNVKVQKKNIVKWPIQHTSLVEIFKIVEQDRGIKCT